MTDTEFLAYTAGFFDADGSVGVYRRTNRYNRLGFQHRLVVGITQKVKMFIFNEWKEWWGGTIYCSRQGPYEQWTWRLGSNKAKKFLVDILPYTRRKHSQAELAILFQSHISSFIGGKSATPVEIEWRDAIVKTLKDMKQATTEYHSEFKDPREELGTQLNLL